MNYMGEKMETVEQQPPEEKEKQFYDTCADVIKVFADKDMSVYEILKVLNKLRHNIGKVAKIQDCDYAEILR